MFMLGLLLHECGHLWAMRRVGLPSSGMIFLPLIGALIAPRRDYRSRSEEAFTAAMGPAIGLAATLPCFGLAWLLAPTLHQAASMALVIPVFNLFNLLPILPLDGGRIVRAALVGRSRQVNLALIWAGSVMALVIGIWLKAWILCLMVGFAMLEFAYEIKWPSHIPGMSRGASIL